MRVELNAHRSKFSRQIYSSVIDHNANNILSVPVEQSDYITTEIRWSAVTIDRSTSTHKQLLDHQRQIDHISPCKVLHRNRFQRVVDRSGRSP